MLFNLFSAIASFYGEGNGTPLQYSCLENPMGRVLGEVGVGSREGEDGATLQEPGGEFLVVSQLQTFLL